MEDPDRVIRGAFVQKAIERTENKRSIRLLQRRHLGISASSYERAGRLRKRFGRWSVEVTGFNRPVLGLKCFVNV